MSNESFKKFRAKFEQDIFPPGWVNPKPQGEYDLLVVGGGPGGMTAATIARSFNARVALVEKEHLGGECLSYGCIPSKALLRSSRVVHEVRRAAEHGIAIPSGWKVDFQAVLQRMRNLQTTLSPHDAAAHFKGLGIDVFFGVGHFTGANQLDVAGEQIRFKKAVIVTGTHPIPLEVPGLNATDYYTNQDIFNVPDLPPRLGVVGGGPIACELSQAFQRFGSKVTLITHGAHLLPKDDLNAEERLQNLFEKEGMRVLLRSSVQRVEKRGNEKILYLDTAQEPVVVDALLVAIGRMPAVDGLDLERAHVIYDKKTGIAVNDSLQTSNPHIYASGDVASPYKFTHASVELSTLAVHNALNGNQEKKTALIVPWCTYTHPEIAHVGLSEEEAKKQGIAYETITLELSAVERAILDGESEGFIKLLVKENTDQILGATLMASHAGEMISEITVAMQMPNGLSTLLKTIHPFPTQSQALRSAAEALLGQRALAQKRRAAR